MPRVDKVCRVYKGRKITITADFDDFCLHCDPGKENLMLDGHPNNKCELRNPASANVLPELPEPVLSINGATEGVKTKDGERLFNKINNLPTRVEIVITKSKGKYRGTKSSSLRQALQDKVAGRLKGLKLESESCKQDFPLTIPAPKSEVVSDSDEEKSRVENVGTSEVSFSDTSAGTTGEKKQKMTKSEIPGTSLSESSVSVVRVVNNCTDLASDPTMQPAGLKTFGKAWPSTR